MVLCAIASVSLPREFSASRKGKVIVRERRRRHAVSMQGMERKSYSTSEPRQFAERRSGSRLSERSSTRQSFIDLCWMLVQSARAVKVYPSSLHARYVRKEPEFSTSAGGGLLRVAGDLAVAIGWGSRSRMGVEGVRYAAMSGGSLYLQPHYGTHSGWLWFVIRLACPAPERRREVVP